MREAPFGYRRHARECAVQALHIAENSKVSIRAGLEQAFEFLESEEFRDEVLGEGGEVTEFFERFARTLAEGVWNDIHEIDDAISRATPGYDIDRLATVDRNVLRVAVWELHNLPYIPPAVTINEAVEIAKRYSTAESGKFVNGVLGTLIKNSDKANWDPAAAPVDPDLPALREALHRTSVEEVEVETIEAGSDEAKKVERFGVWQVKDDEESAG